MSEAGRLTCLSLGSPVKKKHAGHSYFIASRLCTSNQAVGSNCTESVNAENHSTSEILPAEAAAIEVETEPTSEHHNAALKLLQFIPFQPKDVAKIHLTRCQQSQKSGLFCQGWWYTVRG